MLRILYGCGWSSGKSRIAESGPALFFLRGFGYCRYGCRYDWGFVFHVKQSVAVDPVYPCGFERLCKLADFSTLGITCGKTPSADYCFTWNINYFLCRQRRLWAIVTECFTWNKYLRFEAAGGWGKWIRCAPFYRIRFESVFGLYVSRETIIESCTGDKGDAIGFLRLVLCRFIYFAFTISIPLFIKK